MFDSSGNDYTLKEYWDSRFTEEESYEWIADFTKFSKLLLPILKAENEILHVGCGNSRLSFDLQKSGFPNLTNVDFSSVLIEKLARDFPQMKWICDDMRTLESIPDESFDVVIEKAAIESLLANEKSVWTFSESALKDLRSTLASIYRVLKPGGLFASISFTPPYFRVQYLLEQKWDCKVSEFGDGFHFYFYLMKKGSEADLELLENYLKVNST
uniref:Methyltransferase type 11 domain-containing protein n=1 Tax=Panagrolaimus sp. JU765 TaxID=591449 RepID=A0AC34PXK3_9BILA